ncbi:MAG: hypothetical protein WBA45_02610 [Microthrixaceae bacterium]
MRKVSRRWNDPLVVGLVAAVIRLVWVGFMSRRPVGLSDPAIYQAAANSISKGLGYRSITGTVTAYYPPGYPYFLGALKWVVNLVGLDSHFVLVVGVIQALLGATTAALVVVIARRLTVSNRHERVVGVAAGLLVAFWPNLIAHSSVLLSETLFIAVFTLVATLLVKAILGDPNPRTLLSWAALLMGVATLIRPQSALLLIPAAAVAMLIARIDVRRVATHVGALCIGVVLVVMPWSIRSTLALDGLVILSTNSGDNLCIGFNPDAHGGFGMEPACQTETSYTDGPVQERERNSELRSEAVTWALENPQSLPGLGLSKIRLTFDGDHDAIRALESYGQDQFLSDGTRTALNRLADGYYFVVLAFAVAGLAVMLFMGDRQRRSGPVGAVLLTIVLVIFLGALVPVLSFGDQRFKVPIEPFLAIFAAVAVGELWRLGQRRRHVGPGGDSVAGVGSRDADPVP